MAEAVKPPSSRTANPLTTVSVLMAHRLSAAAKNYDGSDDFKCHESKRENVEWNSHFRPEPCRPGVGDFVPPSSARRWGGKASLAPGFHWEAIHVPRRLENSTAAIIVRTMLGPAMVSATYEIRMTVAAKRLCSRTPTPPKK